MAYEWIVARRYLQSKQRAGFLSVTSFIAVGGVILGVAALIIMLSVTNGFTAEVKRRLIGMNAHVKVFRYDGDPITAADTLMARIGGESGVTAMAPIIEGKLGIGTEHEFGGAILWGIDPESFGAVSDLPHHLRYDSYFRKSADDKHPAIVLGAYLANRLRIGIGDRVFLFSMRNQSLEDVMMGGLTPKIHPFVVTDLFESGMYHYDDNYAFIHIDDARDVMATKGVSSIHIRLENMDLAPGLNRRLSSDLGYPYQVKDWTQEFPELFRWMELEKWVIFIALSLIIVVAAFNIMSILTMSILVKTPEIGILRAMGARARGIGRIFVYQGLFIGVFGTALGSLIGLVVCVIQDRFQIVSIPSDIYIISSLPVEMRLLDFLLVSVVSIVICLLAALLPARKAAALQPVEAIRYIM